MYQDPLTSAIKSQRIHDAVDNYKPQIVLSQLFWVSECPFSLCLILLSKEIAHQSDWWTYALMIFMLE